GPDQEVVNVDRLDRRAASGPKVVVLNQPARIPPSKQDADDIAQPIPVHRKRADLEDDRINVWKGQGSKWQKQFGHVGAPCPLNVFRPYALRPPSGQGWRAR